MRFLWERSRLACKFYRSLLRNLFETHSPPLPCPACMEVSVDRVAGYCDSGSRARRDAHLGKVSCSQVFYYYTRYLTDPVGVKTLVSLSFPLYHAFIKAWSQVAAVWLSDTTHQVRHYFVVGSCVMAHECTVTLFGTLGTDHSKRWVPVHVQTK